MAEETPFVADQRPWERADIVICGSRLNTPAALRCTRLVFAGSG
jgi:hypothetical protein